MNIETVNELIQSLESAGELSIKERKYLELAKAYVQLAAENVALKQAAEFATASDMWIEQADGMLDYRYHEWYVDVLKTAMETPATDRIVAGIKAESRSHDLNAFISHYSAELDNHIANGGGQFDERSVRLRGVIVGARMFREKLREEEKALVLREGAK
ncbi:TPA: hypothetical protein ACHJO6_003998 [Klebsiella pneumoniae]|uniref:hypothetical protein n=1 Tax=Raoultella planticola TaxID=575 RepID=UPI001BD3C1F8|nr:hypothetical protein [Raoultella planticola]